MTWVDANNRLLDLASKYFGPALTSKEQFLDAVRVPSLVHIHGTPHHILGSGDTTKIRLPRPGEEFIETGSIPLSFGGMLLYWVRKRVDTLGRPVNNYSDLLITLG